MWGVGTSCGDEKHLGVSVKVAAKGWVPKEQKESWQLSFGKLDQTASPRSLEKRLIFLLRRFLGEIYISMTKRGVLLLRSFQTLSSFLQLREVQRHGAHLAPVQLNPTSHRLFNQIFSIIHNHSRG